MQVVISETIELSDNEIALLKAINNHPHQQIHMGHETDALRASIAYSNSPFVKEFEYFIHSGILEDTTHLHAPHCIWALTTRGKQIVEAMLKQKP